MTEIRGGRTARRRLGRACLGAMALAAVVAVGAFASRAAAGPDVTVIYLNGISNYGAVGGVRAYSLGTTSCNIGDQPLWWCNDFGDPYCEVDQHPVIAQNLYRLEGDRFEQIGMSWLKHGFLSTNSFDNDCRGTLGQTCQSPTHGGDQLGVGCTDAYGSGLNGSRPLGMRSEVDAARGSFPYPYTQVPAGTLADQRIQVLQLDLDPTLHPGARFWMEGQYVAADDAAAGNSLNNASYRETQVNPTTFNLSFAGQTVREKPAITAWQTVDPEVDLVEVDLEGEPVERFHVARKVVAGGPGSWHYEYAVHNMNSDRSARGFVIDFPGGAQIIDTGFHDVDHHSGEPYATTDWAVTVDPGQGTVRWATDNFATDQNANALRWGTMFSFWFDADRPPDGAVHTLELFKPGNPSAIGFMMDSGIFSDGFESGDLTAWSAAAP